MGVARAPSAPGLLSNRVAAVAAAIATGAGAVGLVAETARVGTTTADGGLVLLLSVAAWFLRVKEREPTEASNSGLGDDEMDGGRR